MDNVPAARRLRTESTATELIVWDLIRSRRMMNLKFRRQHPIGRFVVDFYCEELKVAIEIDGGMHLYPEHAARDLDRQLLLEELNIRFIRIPAAAIDGDRFSVMRQLTESLSAMNGSPLPQRERGRGEGRISEQRY